MDDRLCAFCLAPFKVKTGGNRETQKYCGPPHRNYGNQLKWLTNKRKALRDAKST